MIRLPEHIRIVRMREDHLDRMAELEQLCFAMPWSRKMLLSELKNPVARYFVAEEAVAPGNGVCVGYAGMQIVVGEGYVTNIATDPAFRRRGVARALMETLIEYAREHTVDFLTLEVRLSNLAAQNLYKAYGFVEEGVRRGYYQEPKEDAVIMTRMLTTE